MPCRLQTETAHLEPQRCQESNKSLEALPTKRMAPTLGTTRVCNVRLARLRVQKDYFYNRRFIIFYIYTTLHHLTSPYTSQVSAPPLGLGNAGAYVGGQRGVGLSKGLALQNRCCEKVSSSGFRWLQCHLKLLSVI